MMLMMDSMPVMNLGVLWRWHQNDERNVWSMMIAHSHR